MITKIFSLIKSLYVRSGYKLRKCVSPLLMGAVLAIIVVEPLTVLAADSSASTVRVRFGETLYLSKDQTQTFELRVAPKDIDIVGSDKYMLHYDFDIPVLVFTNASQSGFYDLHYNFVGEPYVSDAVEVLDDEKIQLTLKNVYENVSLSYSGDRFDIRQKIRNHFIGEDQGGNSYVSMYYLNVKFSVYRSLPIVSATYWNTTFKIYGMRMGTDDITFTGDGGSYADKLDRIDQSVDYGNLQDQVRWEEDRSDAEDAGSDMTGFASQLDNLKNTWSILWYPIEFTNRFIQVFVGGTQAVAYQDDFAYITGYTYNDETGFLEPIMARSVQPASAGTGITFPAFSLMGYQIWDSYTYDLSQVKDQLPVVFDALYVIISILEMLWFVGYLRKKYEEVFG